MARSKTPSLSFLSKEWADSDVWRRQAREELTRLMSFSPEDTPLNQTIDSSRREDGLVVEEISYDMPYGPRTRGYFLYPEGASSKLPAVVALHNHGGFFYFGKEKVVSSRVGSVALDDHREQSYGGRSWATELAKKGFAVLTVDVFLWGSRRIPTGSVNEELLDQFKGLEAGSDDFVRKFNALWDGLESSVTVSSILYAGATWPGIFCYEDRRSIDYLLTRPEVDASRVACGGLSGGGLRSVFLAGIDPRIRAAFCVGFMSTIGSMLRNHIRGHGLIFYLPHLLDLLDLPDIISLHAPSPLLVQYNRDDDLFSLEGQEEADRKISKIYAKMGQPGNYLGRFYNGPHKFDVTMQEDAFRWLDEVL